MAGHWRKLTNFIFLISLLQSSFLICQADEIAETKSGDLTPQERGRIVPGIHQEVLRQPIFYETFVPLIYEFKTPKWNKTEITFNNWYTCTSETAPYRYSCPVVFHMNQAVMNLHVDFAGIHPIVNPTGTNGLSASGTETTDDASTLDATQYYSSLLSSAEFCNRIQSHFSGIWTKAKRLEGYFETLKNCHWSSGLEPILQRNLSDFNYSVRTPFTRMENNFFNHFYKHIVAPPSDHPPVVSTNTSASPAMLSNNLDLVASALLSNARTTLQAGILGFYYAEKNRWIHANQDCMAKVIPQSIIGRDNFTGGLIAVMNLSGILSGQNELSIGVDLISKYYSLPLTDCSHTDSDSLLVRILIPVLKKNRIKGLQLLHIHNLPFQFQEHICKLKLAGGSGPGEHGGIYQQQSHGLHYLYDELAGLAFPTDCKPNELCLLSEADITNPRKSDRCISALLSRNYPAIKGHCQFECRKQDVETPVVTRIGSNKYVITGSPLYFRVSCEGNGSGRANKEFETHLKSDPSRIGALEVTLPCKCQMLLPRGLMYFSEGLCDSNVTKVRVVPIVPYHFARVKPSSKDGAGAVGEGFYYESLENDNELVNLADYVDFDRVKTYFETGGNSHKQGEGLMWGTEKSEDEHGNGIGWVFLWIIFSIFVLLILILQVYVLYEIRKIKRTGYPMDDRILYRVPDSPVM